MTTITIPRETVQMALDALESLFSGKSDTSRAQRCSDAITALRAALQQAEPQDNEADDLLRRLGLDPEQYRTDGGYINHLKVKAAIRHPESYPQLNQCEHQFVHDEKLGGRLCKLCGTPERANSKAEPVELDHYHKLKDEPQAQAGEPRPFCKVEDVFDNDSILAQLGVKRGDILITLQSHREAMANKEREYDKRVDMLNADVTAHIAKKDAALEALAQLEEAAGLALEVLKKFKQMKGDAPMGMLGHRAIEALEEAFREIDAITKAQEVLK